MIGTYVVFPGSNAGASLKPIDPRETDRRRVVFPGSNAGASLKPVDLGDHFREHRMSSPAAMPGPH